MTTAISNLSDALFNALGAAVAVETEAGLAYEREPSAHAKAAWDDARRQRQRVQHLLHRHNTRHGE